MTSESKSLRCAVVILNYNTAQDTIKLAQSILAHHPESLAIVLVDNCSRDAGSLREFVQSRQGACLAEDALGGSLQPLQLIEVKDNRGYAVGNNVGLRFARRCGCEYAFVINPDVIVRDFDVFPQMIDHLRQHGDAAFAGPRILCPNGTQSPGERLDGWRVLRNFAQPFAQAFRKHAERRAVQRREAMRAGYGIGCFLALDLGRMESAGYFDEATFLYCEEPILAERFRRLGWHFLYLPFLSVYHDHDFSPDWHVGNEALGKSLAHYKGAYLRRSARFWRLMELSERYQALVWRVCGKLKTLAKPGK